MKIKISKSQWEEMGKKAGWKDGYWEGPLKDGYPPTYFDEHGNFKYPWERDDVPRHMTPKNKQAGDSMRVNSLVKTIGDLHSGILQDRDISAESLLKHYQGLLAPVTELKNILQKSINILKPSQP